MTRRLDTDPAARLARVFGFAPFSRLQARRAGLEDDLRDCEASGLARFLRCAGVAGGLPYDSDCELFRVLA